MNLVVDIAHITEFKLLANIFFFKLKNILNYSHNVIYNIIYSSSYKLICKFFNNNSDFKIYIIISAQTIAKKFFCKLTFNIVLKLSSKVIVFICFKIFNL